MPLIRFNEVTFSIAGRTLLDKVDLSIDTGEKVCLIGRNGEGKSTLMRLLMKELSADSGEIYHAGGIRFAYLPQEVPHDLTGIVRDILDKSLQEFDSHLNDQERHHQILKIASYVSIPLDEDASVFSGGMKRRVLLAKALLSEPDLLLLDEPTNHLDLHSINWLEGFLKRYPKALLFVSHDRLFLEKVSNRIIELDRGAIRSFYCTFQQYITQKEALLESEDRSNKLFDKKLSEEERWIRQGIKARRTRNEGRVRDLQKMREARSQRKFHSGKARFQAQMADRSGQLVMDVENISFAYDKEPLVKDFSMTIMRGDKIALMGNNGSGKTTFLKLLLGDLPVSTGFIEYGTNLEMGYFDQHRNNLLDRYTVAENVMEGSEYLELNGSRRHVYGYLQDFLFTPERCKTQASVLSGGERNRVLLAKLFSKPTNILILDEPTNDLDIATMELLEELLVGYEGTILFVSHDREFVNRVATHILYFEEKANITQLVGGYDDYVKYQEKQLAEKGPPKKAKSVLSKKKSSNKLKFHEKRELEEIPNQIDFLENEKEEKFTLLAEPSFYQTSGEKVGGVKERIDQIESELESLYARWEELEAKDK